MSLLVLGRSTQYRCTEGREVARAQCVNCQCDLESWMSRVLCFVRYAVARTTELVGKQCASTARYGSDSANLIHRNRRTGAVADNLRTERKWQTTRRIEMRFLFAQHRPKSRACAIDAFTYVYIRLYTPNAPNTQMYFIKGWYL